MTGILFFFLCISTLTAQNKTFGIYHNNERLGDIRANKSLNNNQFSYTINSVSEVRMIWSYIVTSAMKAEYVNGILISCYSRQDTNEEMKEQSQIKRSGENYSGFRAPDQNIKIKGGISFSTAKLYFEEPHGIDSVFSESYLAYCKLENLGNSRYKLYMPDGNFNYYTYTDNKLKEILVERSMFDLRFVAE